MRPKKAVVVSDEDLKKNGKKLLPGKGLSYHQFKEPDSRILQTFESPGRFLSRGAFVDTPEGCNLRKGSVLHAPYSFSSPETYSYPLDYTITHSSQEVTALCPLTSQPDYYTVNISYIPKDSCIESKSSKLYLGSYRNTGGFIETLAVRILSDWVTACAPFYARVEMTMAPRGGVAITVVREYDIRGKN